MPERRMPTAGISRPPTSNEGQTRGTLKSELRRYTAPALPILDEVGYLPIDQRGADLLFQVISARYERGSIVLTTEQCLQVVILDLQR